MTAPIWNSVLVGPEAPVMEALRVMDASSLQIILVVDNDRKLLGTVTDGDVRRGLLAGAELDAPVSILMNRSPSTMDERSDRATRLALMRQHQFHQIPILDPGGRVVGLETIDDLLKPPKHENRVLLMAGGLGKRMRPLTDTTPKPLLEVGGRPIIETTIRRFVDQGFRNFYISVHYKAEMFEKHFGNGSAFSAHIEYLHEREPLGTAGALSLIREPLTHPVIVMNGDVLTTVNLGRILDFFHAQKASALMCVRDYELQVPYGVVRTDEGKFAAIDEKPLRRFFVNAGLYVLSPEIARLAATGRAIDMPQLFELALKTTANIPVYPISEYWMDIGRSEDFLQANAEYGGHFAISK